MKNLWKTQHVMILYNISGETVRQWSLEFQQYLSPTGQPGSRRRKVFVDEDMQVFSLVAAMKKDRKTYEEIHAALQSGQRGEVPVMPPQEVFAISTTDREKALQLQLSFAQQELLKLQDELQSVHVLKKDLAKERVKNAELQARYDEVKRLQEALQNQIIELTRNLGREYNEGYKAGLSDASKGDEGEG
jgi:DNA-binding transcriptional MerR regulator